MILWAVIIVRWGFAYQTEFFRPKARKSIEGYKWSLSGGGSLIRLSFFDRKQEKVSKATSDHCPVGVILDI